MWDDYFLNICKTISENSKCFSRKIGAIIVNDKSIISTGYNGPPSGIPHCDTRYENDIYFIKKLKNIKNLDFYKKCPRQILSYKSGEGLDLCIAGHAERNALINAAKNGICVKGCIMYMTCNIPCKDCLIEIINSGIKEIVVIDLTYYDEMGKWLIENSNLKVRKYL